MFYPCDLNIFIYIYFYIFSESFNFTLILRSIEKRGIYIDMLPIREEVSLTFFSGLIREIFKL